MVGICFRKQNYQHYFLWQSQSNFPVQTHWQSPPIMKKVILLLHDSSIIRVLQRQLNQNSGWSCNTFFSNYGSNLTGNDRSASTCFSAGNTDDSLAYSHIFIICLPSSIQIKYASSNSYSTLMLICCFWRSGSTSITYTTICSSWTQRKYFTVKCL